MDPDVLVLRCPNRVGRHWEERVHRLLARIHVEVAAALDFPGAPADRLLLHHGLPEQFAETQSRGRFFKVPVQFLRPLDVGVLLLGFPRPPAPDRVGRFRGDTGRVDGVVLDELEQLVRVERGDDCAAVGIQVLEGVLDLARLWRVALAFLDPPNHVGAIGIGPRNRSGPVGVHGHARVGQPLTRHSRCPFL